MKLAIFGMFRSGTNFFWWLLSKDSRFKNSYVEPLHPLLLEERKKYRHYEIYNSLPELEKYFSPLFAFNNFVMKREESYPELKAYLDYLIKDDTLIKINRMPFRINWFMKNFPDVKCVGIIRDPRDYAYAHMVNGPWDPIFFNICAKDKRFMKHFKPLSNEADAVKLLMFWKACLNEMVESGMPLITIEDLNLVGLDIVEKLYDNLGFGVTEEVKGAFSDPDSYSYFWGNNLGHGEVSDTIWSEAIRKTNMEGLINSLGY